MTEDKDEKTVERFLMENNTEIADRGFSRRVMRRLPDRTLRYNRIWTAVYGLTIIILAVKTNALKLLFSNVQSIIGQITESANTVPDLKTTLISLIVIVAAAGWNRLSDYKENIL